METITNVAATTEKKTKMKLVYPAIPTCKSAITNDYIAAYLDANNAPEGIYMELHRIYEDTLNANLDNKAAFVRANQAVAKRFCEIYFPALLVKKEPKPKKPSFRDYLRVHAGL